jgi:hypothetical protein
MRAPVLLAAAVVLLLACVTERRLTSNLGPRPVRELDQWQVRVGDSVAGRLVLIEIEDPRGEARFYRAENARGQWLGYIDQSGRVYQRVPFSMVEVFRGIHTMEDGLALLFEREAGAVAIVPLDRDGQPREAEARR